MENKLSYRFHIQAHREFLSAVDYYDNCRLNLGFEFAEEMYAAIQRILAFPVAWTPLSKNTRRCLINRFPLGIIYTNDNNENEILILAIMQLNRKPDYWHSRLGD